MSVMRVLRTMAVLTICAGLSLPASAGVRRPDVLDSYHVGLGAAHPSVGAVLFDTPSGSYLGSGTLITNGNAGGDWVLTAAHCVDGATSVTFITDANLLDGWSPEDTHEAARFLPHPKWNGDASRGSDIGLIQLANPIESTTIQAAGRYTQELEVGASGVFVGYGRTGTGDIGATEGAGTRRAGNNTIDQLFKTRGKTLGIFAYDFDSGDVADNVFGAADQEDYEYLTSFGDSGGPTFIDGLLAGVHSFVVDENEDGGDINLGDYEGWCNYGDWAGDTRVSAFNRWIDKVIGDDEGGHGGGKPPWAGKPGGPKDSFVAGAPVPEPASLSLLALGALLAVRRRRWR